MFSNRIRIAGFILVFAQISQTFVLLTANIEDVKKIARKFVSEPMAQQIADFISKAAGQQMIHANVSAENEQNEENVDNMSDNEDAVTTPELLRAGSSKRYRKQPRPTKLQTFETTMTTEPSELVEHYIHYRPSKKPQLMMRQRPKQREQVTSPKEEAYYPTQPDLPKLRGEQQLRQHQQLQQQLETLQSQVKEGTITDALNQINKPKRLQKLRMQSIQQRPLQKIRAKPYLGTNQLYKNQLYKNLNQQLEKHQQFRNQNNQYRELNQQQKYKKSAYNDQSSNYKNKFQYKDQNQQQQQVKRHSQLYNDQNQQNKDNRIYHEENQQYKPQNQQYKPQNQQYKDQNQLYTDQNIQYKDEKQPLKDQNQLYNEQVHRYKDENQQYKDQNQQYQDHKLEETETYQPERPTRETYQMDRQTTEAYQTTRPTRPEEDVYDPLTDESKYLKDSPQKNYQTDDTRNRPVEADQIVPSDRQPEPDMREDDRESIQPEQRVHEESTPEYQLEYEHTTKRHRSRSRTRDRFALLENPSTDTTIVKKSTSRFPAFNIQSELTTEKNKIEFDQYDNIRGQPLVATSGPVALKAADPWWMKDLPTARSRLDDAQNVVNAQMAPVPPRPPGDKSTMVINLFVKQETTPSTTTIDIANLGNLGNVI